MKTRIIFVLLVFLNVGITPESFAAATSDNSPNITNSVKATVVANAFDQSGYYTYRPDLRLCPSPICGGIFVKKANKKKTLCADGSYQIECYVAAVSWATKGSVGLNTGNKKLLLQGFIAKKNYSGFGPLGIFKVNAAYTPVTNKPLDSKIQYVGLENNGIVCFTTPCFTIDEHILNTNKTRLISGIDLSHLGTKQQVSPSFQGIGLGNVLLAAGYNQQTTEPTGLGVIFVAKEIYVPVKKPIGICPDGYTAIGGQCVTPIGCVAPQIELETSGGAVYIDPVTGETISNITQSCVTQCLPPGILDRPAHCSVFYP